MKIRPLGSLSDYVVEQMPAQEANFREIIDLVPKDMDVEAGYNQLALLDIQMLRSAMIHRGITPPPALEILAAKFSEQEGVPNILTYEQIVIVNPQYDMRTFTSHEIGRTERFFYGTNRRVDEALKPVTERMLMAIGQCVEDNYDAAVASLRSYLNNMNSAIDAVKESGEINRDHFDVFRPYLTGHRGFKGPSGLFSPGVVLFDLFLAGKRLPDSHRERVSSDINYYPEKERIVAALEQETCLLDFAQNRKELGSVILELVDGMLKLRAAHYCAVSKQVPDAIKGNVLGTAGQKDVAKFLRGPIQMYRGFRTMLETGE